VTALAWLVPAALLLGALGLLAFLWALRSGQFDDLEGAAYRALEDDPPEDPLDRTKRREAGAKNRVDP
jgi:cbb3-type cytochrome oxidase maturation protein